MVLHPSFRTVLSPVNSLIEAVLYTNTNSDKVVFNVISPRYNSGMQVRAGYEGLIHEMGVKGLSVTNVTWLQVLVS